MKYTRHMLFVQKHKEQEEEKKRVRMRAHLSIPVYCTIRLHNFFEHQCTPLAERSLGGCQAL